MAAEVEAFYDRYPYPPPVDDLDGYVRRWRDSRKRHADFHRFWPTTPYRESYAVLVAGCGTSQAAKHAIRCPQAEVTGIDFSATSIEHTRRLKLKHGLENLRLIQLPLERVGELGTSFDQVICTGVLHHLDDPEAGLRALRAVLRPEGALHLMVYAPYGRSGIYMLQEFCRCVGFRAATGDLRELRLALEALPPEHPMVRLLQEAPDFRSEAGLADALLNPQDRAYSVPQLFALLQSSGLVFGRWIRQAPYRLQAGLMSRLPCSMRAASIPREREYAAAELFRGTMTRHSLIAYRHDHPRIPSISFDGEGWLRYVPIREPDTRSIDEHLPPGIAAILINRAHSYTDIGLPLRKQEKALLEAIDGRRTIGELVATPGEREPARSLFERLWWYDQVVFDATR